MADTYSVDVPDAIDLRLNRELRWNGSECFRSLLKVLELELTQAAFDAGDSGFSPASFDATIFFG